VAGAGSSLVNPFFKFARSWGEMTAPNRRSTLQSHGPYLSHPGWQARSVNSARYFIRREDDEPPRTPAESPFRRFDVKCLKCGSYRLTLAGEFSEEAGELRVLLRCSRCRQCEELQVR
jgi:hypothetical protein